MGEFSSKVFSVHPTDNKIKYRTLNAFSMTTVFTSSQENVGCKVGVKGGGRGRGAVLAKLELGVVCSDLGYFCRALGYFFSSTPPKLREASPPIFRWRRV